jgi:hypothetical protein
MLDAELVSYLDRRFTESAAQTAALVATQVATLDQSLRAHIDEKIGEVRILVEDLHTNIQLGAEGVIATQESLAAFRAEVDRQFQEVKAVNRLSYVELERRLSKLES